MLAFEKIFNRFDAKSAPFMHKMRDEWAREKPVKGLRIAHNIPLTLSTLLKLECLRLGGADLTVSNYSYCTPDPEALKALSAAGLPFVPVSAMQGEFDILLDCGAELLTRCEARLGAVELTRTGAVAYSKSDVNYPVVSVDDARLKQLETCLGTGEGVYRAICNLAQKDLRGARVVIFGFGKVGRGIAHYFKAITNDIHVVEMLPDRLSIATDRGFDAISANHKNEVEDWVSSADVVITATGRKSVISDYYDPASFRDGALLANAGAEDEYGDAFTSEEVLFGKGPVNFSQEEPTRIEFLDPIFYAHNIAVLDLLANPAERYQALNQATDDAVMKQWCALHGRDEAELEAIFG